MTMMWPVAWLCVCLAVLGQSEGTPSVAISQGQLQGAFRKSRGGRQFSAFQGIPYASPPLGPLRFQKPLPAAAWHGVRDATNPGSPCIQSNHTGKGLVFGSEDCLYLNVYTHKVSNDSKYPVMVYIHGGGFMEQSGDLYQPDFLMDRDIVLVTLNYRLGALGFLSMEDRELPGNNGLKDQTAALRWVKDNIAQFGGDPDSVTIFGESAGAASVHYHMLSPLTKGLFHRAISQSGSAYCPWANHAPGQLREVSERFAALLGCNHPSTHDSIVCMRDIPAYVLVEITSTGLHEWQLDPVIPFPPAIEPEGTEGAFLTKDPWKLSSDVPWVTGITSSEGVFKVNMFDNKSIIELNDDFEMIGPVTLLFRSTAEDPVRIAFAIKKFYFFDGDIKPENIESLTNMYTDCWFFYPLMESFRRHKGPKYLYYFDYRGSNSFVPEHKGVSHGDELQYLFPMRPFLKNINSSAEDLKISEKLIDFWINFTIHGKPTLKSSSITWIEATKSSDYLHIKDNGFVMGTDLLKERDYFWSKLPYREKYNSDDLNKDEL